MPILNNLTVNEIGGSAPTNYTMAVVSDIVTLEDNYTGGIAYNDPSYDYFTEISFPKLETITTDGSLYMFASGLQTITRMSFPSLTTVEGEESFRDVCNSCPNLVSADIHNLTTVSGRAACIGVFTDCSLLTSIDLSNLTTVGDYQDLSIDSGCWQMLAGTGITELRLPSLVSVGYTGLGWMCYNCSSLEKAYFNSLDPSRCDPTALGGSTEGDWIFDGCDAMTEIHFPQGTQAAISQWDGYSEKFGATNATIYFDL